MFEVALSFKHAFQKLDLIFAVENAERQVNYLGFANEQDEGILALLGAFDLIPFHGHTLFAVKLDQDLLTVDLVR